MQIVTIHKSKGAGYPLAFLPFICSHRTAETPCSTRRGGGQSHRARSDRRRPSLAEADRERPTAEICSCSVALTRASTPPGSGLAPVRAGAGKSEKTDLHRTAIGYLLQKGGGDAGTLATALTELAQALPGWPSVSPRSPARPRCRRRGGAGGAQVRRVPGQLERDWWISSYSGWRPRATAQQGGAGQSRLDDGW